MAQPIFTFVVTTLSGGGAERVVSVLASQLAEMGYETHIFAHNRAQGEYPVSSKVDVYYDAESKSGKKLDILRKIPAIRRKVREWNSTYVIPFLHLSMVLTYAATRFTGVKFIATIRNNPRMGRNKWTGLCNWIVSRADALFAQTEDERSYYPPQVQQRSFVLPNPVNEQMLEAQHAYRTPMGRLVAAGRLIDQKNYPMLVEAMEIVAKRHPEAVLRIYGVGNREKQIRQMLSDKGLDANVRLMGRSNDMASVLNESDIFVMTSNFEGMPNALMEAMAVGLPCVSTDCPSGPADLITSGENGLLVPVNDPEAFAAAMEQLLEDPELARRLGEKAKQTMTDGYTPERIAKRFVEECLRY